MADALVLDGVSKVYEVGGVELIALNDVDLTVAEEEVVTLLGPSGSGKTTLLSIAGGLLSATSGKVIVGGKNITRARARKLTAFRRKRIGFIFQAVNLVPFLTARENLLVVAELARRDRAAAAKRADRLLDELGLGHRLGNLPAQLSGGERQRVAIGRALMNQPALVLVDEPTSALDSDLGQQVMELIVSEVKARGAAAVIVTHDQRMARYGDRILTMADGRIAGMAPRPEFTHNRGPAAPPELAPARNLRALPAAAPGPGHPAAGSAWRTDEHRFAPRTGQVPAAGREPDSPSSVPWPNDPAASSGAGPASGQWPATGHGGGPGVPDGRFPAPGRAGGFDGAGAGPASGQWPATGHGGGPGVPDGRFPAPGRAGGFDGAGAGAASGQWPATGDGRGSGWPTADDSALERERKEVPAGLWANGPAVTPGTGSGSAGSGGTGQVPAIGHRPDPYDGLPGPRSDEPPAAHGRPPTGPQPIAQPVSSQTPIVPAPDRVWRRPATPPSSRTSGGRRPPQLRPAHPAPPPSWPAPQPSQPSPPPPSLPPQAPLPPQADPAFGAPPGSQSDPAFGAPPGPQADPATWASPDPFAEQPVAPSHPPAAPVPPPSGSTPGVDPVESDRVRWLQQLRPPPTKAQPRPLTLPDRPIWPTRYWDDDAPAPNGVNDDYDYGEYDED